MLEHSGVPDNKEEDRDREWGSLPARVGVQKKTLQAAVEDMTEALQQPWCPGTSARG